jgi:DNA-binding PadR family transcriptional regulator
MVEVLNRLESLGWITRYWEEEEVAFSQKRPARHYCRLTDAGLVETKRLINLVLEGNHE